MRKIREVIRLRRSLLLSVREIAASCAIGRTTVAEYLRRSEAAGLGWPLPDDLDDQGLERRLFPPPATGEGASRPMPDWPQVRRELSRKGVTLLLLWHEYKQWFPEGYGYSRYAELYRAWEKTTHLSMLQRHKAGEKLFVDFAGLTMPVTDPATGEVRKVQIYAGTIPRHSAWSCHSPSLGPAARFGGAREVTDNVRLAPGWRAMVALSERKGSWYRPNLA